MKKSYLQPVSETMVMPSQAVLFNGSEPPTQPTVAKRIKYLS